jgi:hypothetical protein
METGDYSYHRQVYQFETISRGNYICGIHFPVLFLYIFTSLKIDGAVTCLSFDVNIASFDNVKVNNLPQPSVFFLSCPE